MKFSNASEPALPVVRAGVGVLALTLGMQILICLARAAFDLWMACTPKRSHYNRSVNLETGRSG